VKRAPGARIMLGMFVILDGLDGCGKSTQAELLVAALGSSRAFAGRPLHLREPGSTEVGERVRELLLDRGLTLSAEVETLLFCAARRQMLDELVQPALDAGRDVICERFHPSTFAYQGVAGDLDPDRVLALLTEWANRPSPDLIVLFDLDVSEALVRRGAARDRIEDKGAKYLARVAEGYRLFASRHPRARVIDAGRDVSLVARDVFAAVEAARRGEWE